MTDVCGVFFSFGTIILAAFFINKTSIFCLHWEEFQGRVPDQTWSLVSGRVAVNNTEQWISQGMDNRQ